MVAVEDDERDGGGEGKSSDDDETRLRTGPCPFFSLPNTSNGHDEARLSHPWEKHRAFLLFCTVHLTYFAGEKHIFTTGRWATRGYKIQRKEVGVLCVKLLYIMLIFRRC